ncbi:MAG: peptidoglycan editing factor PgeF [Anaerolineales bacterium]|nr:peptidoglycan editing factor PgeF [Anaerolineales bacterium]
MPFQSQNGIRYLTFDLFGVDVVQAVFTRRGGVSPAPWAALNLGGTVGDDPQLVAENRRRAFAALGRAPDSLYDVWQVHGTDVVVAGAPRSPERPLRQADVILTDRPGVTLFMRFADCVPVLLHDPQHGVVGIAHAGWMGTVRGTARAAVEALVKHFNSNPAELQAAIGPSIGSDHYEVGPDVVVQVRQAFGDAADQLLAPSNGRMRLDLWAANQLLLEQAGVRQIEVSGICTACHVDDWYSHRLEKGRTGRFGAMIGLRE